MRLISSVGASVGHDRGSPVSPRYRDGFAFEGHLARVDIQLVPVGRAHVGEQAAVDQRATMSRQ